jgi:hypothetical protein
MDDISHLRIVEIGDKPFVKLALPHQVTYFSTWADDDAQRVAADGNAVVSLHSLAALCRALREPATSLVVCHPTFFSPWHWRWITRTVFDRRMWRRSAAFVRGMGPQVLRWPISAPIAILDQTDIPLINRNNFFLVDRCRVYFKRELPPDRWRLFLKTGHANLPTPRFSSRCKRGRVSQKFGQPIRERHPAAFPEGAEAGCSLGVAPPTALSSCFSSSSSVFLSVGRWSDFSELDDFSTLMMTLRRFK